MKIIRKKNILIILLSIALISVSIFIFRSEVFRRKPDTKHPDTADRKVILILSPEYDGYFINQDIWMKVVVVNNSDDNYYLKLPLNRTYTNFYRTYPSGKIITDSITVNRLKPPDSLKLLPGGSYEKVMTLNKTSTKLLIDDINETGIYIINATYQDLVSNELKLPVTVPAGIDKELYDQTYGKLFAQNISEEERVYKLEDLLKKYPATKYSPQLYNIFFRESNFTNDYNRSSENISDFFKYNNDTYGAGLILDIGNHNLEKLSSKYRDSKTGYMIRQRKKEALTHK